METPTICCSAFSVMPKNMLVSPQTPGLQPGFEVFTGSVLPWQLGTRNRAALFEIVCVFNVANLAYLVFGCIRDVGSKPAKWLYYVILSWCE